MKKRFERHEIKKDKQIMSRAEGIIKKMLQSSNPHDLTVGINELNTYNLDFKSRYSRTNYHLTKLSLVNFEKRFVGFHVF